VRSQHSSSRKIVNIARTRLIQSNICFRLTPHCERYIALPAKLLCKQHGQHAPTEDRRSTTASLPYKQVHSTIRNILLVIGCLAHGSVKSSCSFSWQYNGDVVVESCDHNSKLVILLHGLSVCSVNVRQRHKHNVRSIGCDCGRSGCADGQ
jgi:hypothetical protein